MSLNHLIHNVEKPWFNMGVKNISIDENLDYKNDERVVDYTLKLVRNPGTEVLTAEWRAAEPRNDNIYNNTVSVIVESKTYSIPENMTFFGFKYATPSYYVLSPDKKTIQILDSGTYLLLYNMATYETNRSSEFSVYIDGELIPESISSFIPSRDTPTVGRQQYIVCSSFCLFNTEPGITTVQIKISPTAENNVDSRGSIVTIIKLYDPE